jgi:sulfatase modifying factor 1
MDGKFKLLLQFGLKRGSVMKFESAPFIKIGILLVFVVLYQPFSNSHQTQAGENVFTNSLGMEFVLVPAGRFVMGSSPDEPHRSQSEFQHPVTISRPFYIQTTEVTLKQWRAVMGKRFFGPRKGTDNSPVVQVSWQDCKRFIKKLNAKGEGNYRLPTEAQWEYACRANTATAYSWGNTIDCSKAMYANKSMVLDECQIYLKSIQLPLDRPAPVASFAPNAWGIYDMHGNVWEWCADFYGPYPKEHVIDPVGPDSGTYRIRRGGSWFKYGYSCRSANRNYGNPFTRLQTTGFRLVREIE